MFELLSFKNSNLEKLLAVAVIIHEKCGIFVEETPFLLKEIVLVNGVNRECCNYCTLYVL